MENGWTKEIAALRKKNEELAVFVADLKAENKKLSERYDDALADKKTAVRGERHKHCACEFKDGLCIVLCKLHGDKEYALRKWIKTEVKDEPT